MAYRVGKDQFGTHIEAALAELPAEFAAFLERVPIEVRDRPTPQQLKMLNLGRDQLLLGLYMGTNLASRSVMNGVELPAVIYLFQDDIEQVCNSADELRREIRKTVLHEIGHHFGLDEDDLSKLGYG